MHFRTLFILQSILIAIIASIHISALNWSLYWYYLWLDVPVHFLGGAWIALAISWILARKGFPLNARTILATVMMIGVAWELFELAAGVPIEESFALDTTIDLTMDMIGGAVGFVVARSLIGRDTIRRNEEAEDHSS